MQNFIKEIEKLGPLIDVKHNDINDAANNGIISRLIRFKVDPDLTSINE